MKNKIKLIDLVIFCYNPPMARSEAKILNLQYTVVTSPLPDFIYKGLREYSAAANAYHPQPAELITKLADKYRIPQEMLLLTAGANEGIRMFALAYGERTVVFTPSFISYKEIEDFHASVEFIPSMENDVYVINTSHRPDATLIFLANPNNPVGFTPKEKVLELVRNNPQAKVVIDEVYAEFAELSVIDEVKNHPNLAVLRSFSKAYAMAGNRVGFIVAQKPLIDEVSKKTTWTNVSYLSIGAAIIALDHEEYFENLRQGIIDRRKGLATFLNEQGFNCLNSQINCIMLKFGSEDKGSDFVKYLKSKNVIVSHGNANSNVGLDYSFVRIAVGTEEEINLLKEVIAGYGRII
ncbi:MAG: hypothetical protein ACD_37C00076G0007 [uncultured bacterium]|nr:MAG: hypothetical protein ACD_37C00076G0007 [uncultured bacterium]